MQHQGEECQTDKGLFKGMDSHAYNAGFRSGDPLQLEQDGQDTNKPLHFHGMHRLSCFYLHYTIETGQLYVMFDLKATGGFRSLCG